MRFVHQVAVTEWSNHHHILWQHESVSYTQLRSRPDRLSWLLDWIKPNVNSVRLTVHSQQLTDPTFLRVYCFDHASVKWLNESKILTSICICHTGGSLFSSASVAVEHDMPYASPQLPVDHHSSKNYNCHSAWSVARSNLRITVPSCHLVNT